MRNFEVDSAVLKWEAALADLQQGQHAVATAMQLYGAGEAEYPYELVAAVLRLRGVHERRYDAAAIALHAAKVHAQAPQAHYVEYALPVPLPAQAEAGKWRPHLPSRAAGAAASASVQ